MPHDPMSMLHPPDRIPPFRALIAICARSSQGLTAWFRGEFDGQHWRARDLPGGAQEWFVSGWCEGEPRAHAGVPATFSESLLGNGPVLMSVDA